MNPKPYLAGSFYFDDGVRAVLIKQGTKYIHCLYLEGCELRKARLPNGDLKYLTETANSNDNLKEIKRIAKILRGKNSLSGSRRHMTKAVKEIINEILLSTAESPRAVLP